MSTSEDLQTAFAGESMANRKYTAFARKADSEGEPQVARLFRAAAHAETVHALNHYRAMGMVRSTAENLQVGIDGEAYEFQEMYPGFLAAAEKAGDNPVAVKSFRYALEAEKDHWELYRKALQAVEKGQDLPVQKMWVCEVCGHTVEGDEPPEKCPICNAGKKAYTEIA
jgi:rubrerythrin